MTYSAETQMQPNLLFDSQTDCFISDVHRSHKHQMTVKSTKSYMHQMSMKIKILMIGH